MFNPIRFLKEVKQEALKIKWSSWEDTRKTGTMVLVLIAICSAAFWIIDAGIQFLVNFILK